MEKRVESAAKVGLEAVAGNTFEGKVVTLAMSDDGVDFAKTNPDLNPEVVAKLSEVKADIISRKINVVPTYAESVAQGLVPEGLGAMDN